VFTNVAIAVPAVQQSAIAWGDLDNDGRLDVVLAGDTNLAYLNYYSVAQIWQNAGAGSFSNINSGFPGVDDCTVAWADFDNDGYADVLLAGYTGSNYITQLWRNNGNGTFTNMHANLPGLLSGSVAWGDYDNDGRPDILLTGQSGATYVSQVWRNMGGGVFSNLNLKLPGVHNGSVAWADFDNDGRLDFLLTGCTTTNTAIAQIWRNLGNGAFTNTQAGLTGVCNSAVACGDFDNDGFLDILICGTTTAASSPRVTQIWRNRGDGTFTNIQAALPGMLGDRVSWGDYDNDGRPDVLLSGTADGTPTYFPPGFQVWQNLGGGSFARITAASSEVGTPAIWGDFDQDGRLDILVGAGTNFPGPMVLLQNTTPIANTPPTAPSGLGAILSKNGALVSWSAASDAQTPIAGLSYNVRIGTRPGGIDVVSPLSDTSTGLRRVVALGNAQERLFCIITNLHYGLTYYWSVQAIDSAFAGGPFASESSFAIPFIPATATTYYAYSSYPTSGYLEGRVNPNDAPTSAWFQYGFDTNYGGTTALTNLAGNSTVYLNVAVSNLAAQATYHCRVVASNIAGVSFGSDLVFQTPAFGMTFSGPSGLGNAIVWGDFDNDGLLDMLVYGAGTNGPITQIWRNQGDGTFADINAGINGISCGNAVWVDFDNDGYLDVFLTGFGSSGYTTELWRNLGNGSFSNVNAALPIFSGCGSGVWVDFDNDGLPDLFMGGYDGTNYVTRIWRNLGGGTFTNVDAGFPGLDVSVAAAADFDGDGWMDLLVTGISPSTGFNIVSQLWRNQGNGTFANVNAGLPGVFSGSVAWGDMDNDGRPDIVLTGTTNGGTYPVYITQVWRNTGNGTFTNTHVAIPLYSFGSATWGDYDNDGLIDLLLGGQSLTGEHTYLWRNQGNGGFTNVDAGLPLWSRVTTSFADFDNDGRLDIGLAGPVAYGAGTVNFAEAWRNFAAAVTNTAPGAPSHLSASAAPGGVRLSWNDAIDAQTPSTGLTYNLRVGTTPGGWDIVSPLSSPATGFRRVAQRGNAEQRLFAILTQLTPGRTYYWSVQAVDGAYAGGPFAPESTFTYTPPPIILMNGNFGWQSGKFGFDFLGQSGHVAVVQASSNLVNWIPVTNVTLGSGPQHFIDSQSAGFSRRFYRVVLP
jgi:hypothetical protein